MRRVLVVGSLLLMMFCMVALTSAQEKEKSKPKATAVELSEDITPPKLLEVANPEYTAEAKKKRIEGEVKLAIVVDEKGDVIDATVLKGLGYGLDENAVEAVKYWRYKPALKDDKPVAVKMEVSTSFILHE